MYKLSSLMPEILNSTQYHKQSWISTKIHIYFNADCGKTTGVNGNFNDEPSPYLKGLGQLKTRKSQKKTSERAAVEWTQ